MSPEIGHYFTCKCRATYRFYVTGRHNADSNIEYVSFEGHAINDSIYNFVKDWSKVSKW